MVITSSEGNGSSVSLSHLPVANRCAVFAVNLKAIPFQRSEDQKFKFHWKLPKEPTLPRAAPAGSSCVIARNRQQLICWCCCFNRNIKRETQSAVARNNRDIQFTHSLQKFPQRVFSLFSHLSVRLSFNNAAAKRVIYPRASMGCCDE